MTNEKNAKGASVKATVHRQHMGGQDTITLEIQGTPDNDLDEVLTAWDERFERLLEEADANDAAQNGRAEIQ